MAMSVVRKLTLAFIRGEVSAEEVVKQIRSRSIQPQKSAEQVTLETSEDFQEVQDTTDTWADVGRYFDMMTPEQQGALESARIRRFGE